MEYRSRTSWSAGAGRGFKGAGGAGGALGRIREELRRSPGGAGEGWGRGEEREAEPRRRAHLGHVGEGTRGRTVPAEPSPLRGPPGQGWKPEAGAGERLGTQPRGSLGRALAAPPARSMKPSAKNPGPWGSAPLGARVSPGPRRAFVAPTLPPAPAPAGPRSRLPEALGPPGARVLPG